MMANLEMFEKGAYLTPSEKHVLVKNMGFTLFLMDCNCAKCLDNSTDGSDKCSTSDVNDLCKAEIPRLDRIFKETLYVPLFGDMQVCPFDHVRKTKSFNPSHWPLSQAALENLDQVPVQLSKFNIQEFLRTFFCNPDHLKLAIVYGFFFRFLLVE